MPVASVILAVVAAVLFALSTVLQQNSARSTLLRSTSPSTRAWLPVLGVLGRLLRDPAWILGWLLNVLGFTVHAGEVGCLGQPRTAPRSRNDEQ